MLSFTIEAFYAMLGRGEIDACRALLDSESPEKSEEHVYLSCRADYLRRVGDMRGAFEACLEIADRFPGWAGSRYTLSDVAAHLGTVEEALPAVERVASAFVPDAACQIRAEAWYAMGLDRETIALQPRRDEASVANFLARMHVAQSTMRLHGIASGLAEYEATWTSPQAWQCMGYVDAARAQTLWHAQCAPPRRLMVARRGGIGDRFLWSRYLARLQSGNIQIEYEPGLQTGERAGPLRKGSVHSFGDLPSAPQEHMWVDPFTLFTGLFRRFGYDSRSEPLYLAPQSEVATAVAASARQKAKGKACIALFWSANESHGNFAVKSACLPHVKPLLERDDVHWVVVQRGHQMRLWLADPGSESATNVIDPLTVDDLSGLLAQLDGAIVVDSAVAHIAASLGVPTWLLASAAACWRYESFAQFTPWYPAMRLFRQPKLGDWDGAVRNICAALPSLA